MDQLTLTRYPAFFIPRKHQLVMLIVLLCAWLPISSMVSFSHSLLLAQQTEQSHSGLAVDITEHNHSHHHSEAIEQTTDHLHEHVNFDHDHDLPQILIGPNHLIHPPQIDWLQQLHAADYPALNYLLERPPHL